VATLAIPDSVATQESPVTQESLDTAALVATQDQDSVVTLELLAVSLE